LILIYRHLNVVNYRTRGDEKNVNGKERRRLLLNDSYWGAISLLE
jgi:hypothetical protein